MTIKLITVNDVKISLSPGEHVFGRHKILYVSVCINIYKYLLLSNKLIQLIKPNIVYFLG